MNVKPHLVQINSYQIKMSYNCSKLSPIFFLPQLKLYKVTDLLTYFLTIFNFSYVIYLHKGDFEIIINFDLC